MTAGSTPRGRAAARSAPRRNRGPGAFARAFAAARSGGVALPFALSLITVSFLTVAAVDFHRGQNVRTALQADHVLRLRRQRSLILLPPDFSLA